MCYAGDFPSGPVLLPQGAQVQFLVRELRSQCCMVQSKKKKKKVLFLQERRNIVHILL